MSSDFSYSDLVLTPSGVQAVVLACKGDEEIMVRVAPIEPPYDYQWLPARELSLVRKGGPWFGK